MDKFCVITNFIKDENFTVTKLIKEFLEINGKECFLTNNIKNNFTDFSLVPEDTQCAIVLGGDGTLIQTVNNIQMTNIPILGINLGTLGFLTDVEKSDIQSALLALINDEYSIENRIMLDGIVYTNDKIRFNSMSLNDIIVTRTGFSRIISVSIYVNDEFVDCYKGDGVIISTPTGSTGYNLSAGGPIVSPQSDVMIITPICPHSLNKRSIVVPASDLIKAQISLSKKTQEQEAMLTFGGNESTYLKTDDMIVISKSSRKVKIIKLNGTSFFKILRNKI